MLNWRFDAMMVLVKGQHTLLVMPQVGV